MEPKEASYFADLVNSEQLTIAIKLIKSRYSTNCLLRDVPEAELAPAGEIGDLLSMMGHSSPKDWINENNYWDKPISFLLGKAFEFVKFQSEHDDDDDRA